MSCSNWARFPASAAIAHKAGRVEREQYGNGTSRYIGEAGGGRVIDAADGACCRRLDLNVICGVTRFDFFDCGKLGRDRTPIHLDRRNTRGLHLLCGGSPNA